MDSQINNKIALGKQIFTNSYSYSKEQNFAVPVRSIKVFDLNGDGLDEIILGGFETQPNTPETFTKSVINIFGWKNGTFTNITSEVLPNSENEIEALGDIGFGDFDSDGDVDFYTSGNADMNLEVTSYQFINDGAKFIKTNLGLSMWEHGVAVGDINNDGYDDLIPFGWSSLARPLVGSESGLRRIDGEAVSGSGGVISDFLGDGSKTLIIVDYSGGINDTRLLKMSLSTDNSFFYTEVISELPTPILESYDFTTENNNKSHDIRVIAHDFNHDGLDDAIVLSRGGYDGRRWVEISAVQFLKNQGEGVFVDVTDSLLSNYHSESFIGYTPILRDFNSDGWMDIFLSDSSWEGVNDSTTIIFGQSDETFIDHDRKVFSDVLGEVGGTGALIKGPNEKYYFAAEDVFWGGQANISLYEVDFPDRRLSETLKGTPLDDRIYGLQGNDLFTYSTGNDFLDGGEGVDGYQSEELYSNQMISRNDSGAILISDGRKIDELVSVERIHFKNMSLAMDTLGATSAGGIFRLYKATFDRTPDLEGLGYWIDRADNGRSAVSMAEDFVWSQEFQQLYGIETKDQYLTGSDITALVTGFYRNVLDRDPDQKGLNFYVDAISNQERTVGRVLAEISDSPENYAATIGLIQNGIQYDVWLG